MKHSKHFLTMVIALVLVCVLALTGCSGTINSIKQSIISEQMNTTENLDDTPIKPIVDPIAIGSGSLIISEVDSKDSGEIVGIDAPATYDDDLSESSTENEPIETAFSFAVYETAYKLSQLGYDVYRGAAVISSQKQVPGLLYTAYENNVNGDLVGGFLEILEANQFPTVTNEIVQNGLIAVADSETQTQGFVIDRFVSLPDSSGIYGDYYFTNKQTSDFAVSLNVVEDKYAVYDENIDCIDYNTGKTLWLADTAPTISFEALSLYTADEVEAYNAAVCALEQIVALQNTNAYEGTYASLVIIETALLESIALNNQSGMIGNEEDGYYSLSALNSIELEENQILMVTANDGVQILTIPTAEELKAAADSRAATGLIQIIGGALLAFGSIAICVITCGTAAPAVAAVCIATGAIATTYAVSNVIEGVSNVYYGLKGDITTAAVNPVKDLIVKAVGDVKKGETIYHAVGISASLIQSLMIPFAKGLSLANAMNASVGQTFMIIARAVSVEVVKMAVTAGVSYLTSIGLSAVTTKYTGSVAAGQLVGFAGALLTGFVTYKGLTALDKKYNFSGLYSKHSLGKQFDDSLKKSNAGNKEPDTTTTKKPINSKYAGKTMHFDEGTSQSQKYPDGVDFSENGYPRFEKYAIKTATFDKPSPSGLKDNTCLTGNYRHDTILANQQVGLKETPVGYVWHHVEDLCTMILVPQDIHSVVFGGIAHSGGASLIRALISTFSQ